MSVSWMFVTWGLPTILNVCLHDKYSEYILEFEYDLTCLTLIVWI